MAPSFCVCNQENNMTTSTSCRVAHYDAIGPKGLTTYYGIFYAYYASESDKDANRPFAIAHSEQIKAESVNELAILVDQQVPNQLHEEYKRALSLPVLNYNDFANQDRDPRTGC